MTPDPQPRSARLTLLLAALVVVVGAFVPLPGLDYEALDAVMGGRLLPPVGLVGETIPWLATVWFALIAAGWDDRPAARTIAFVVYLVVVAVQGVGIALYFESLNGSFMFDVVADPGWRFRLQTSLIWSAGAALVWYVAMRIEATESARGALFLLLIRVALDHATMGWDVGRAYGAGTAEMAWMLGWLVAPLAVALVGVALWMRPRTWPVTLRGREVRSWWDALALVALAVIPGSFVSSLQMWGGTATNLVWVDAALSLVVATGVVTWWWRGDDADTRASAPALFGAAFFAAALVPALAGYVISGGLDRAIAPAPLAGDASFTLTLRAEGGSFAEGDPHAMLERLDRLGADAEIVDRLPGEIRLSVRNASNPQAVLDALRPTRFELRMVAETFEVECSGPGEAQPPSIEGCRPLRDASAGEPGRCVFQCVEPRVELSNRDVEETSVFADDWGTGVALTLTSDAAQRFADLTGESVGRKLAIVIDDLVMSAPVIRERIPGGRIQISMGAAQRDVLADAEALAAALQPGAEIRTRWTYDAIE